MTERLCPTCGYRWTIRAHALMALSQPGRLTAREIYDMTPDDVRPATISAVNRELRRMEAKGLVRPIGEDLATDTEWELV